MKNDVKLRFCSETIAIIWHTKLSNNNNKIRKNWYKKSRETKPSSAKYEVVFVSTYSLNGFLESWEFSSMLSLLSESELSLPTCWTFWYLNAGLTSRISKLESLLMSWSLSHSRKCAELEAFEAEGPSSVPSSYGDSSSTSLAQSSVCDGWSPSLFPRGNSCLA